MTDNLESRSSGVERTVTLAVLGGLGVVLGLRLGDQSFMACILWGLVGGIATAPITIGATRVARYLAERRRTR
ncbi:hypothetical protein [Streptomyces olivaceoviridis]|uniref:hypothetical protein n=1 Tax=Streptomyces olivaceoviridis TaxID=1921 RepID=UPI0037B874C4